MIDDNRKAIDLLRKQMRQKGKMYLSHRNIPKSVRRYALREERHNMYVPDADMLLHDLCRRAREGMTAGSFGTVRR